MHRKHIENLIELSQNFSELPITTIFSEFQQISADFSDYQIELCEIRNNKLISTVDLTLMSIYVNKNQQTIRKLIREINRAKGNRFFF
jgi:hypothetical protein